MFIIELSDQQDLIKADLDRLKDIACDLLTREQVASAEISVALIDSQTMQHLNNTHLGHDYDTDVLSFLLDSAPETNAGAIPRGAGKTIEGEVLVSTKIAQQAAAEHDWDVGHEIALYVVHGLLHLLGYDDLSDEEQRIMQARERFHLARWDLVPPGR